MYNICDLIACQYNEEGECIYDNAPIKAPCAKACDSQNFQSNDED